MRTRRLAIRVVALVAVATTGAQTTVSWGDAVPGTDFLINDTLRTITILRGLNQNYKFWAHAGTGTPGTGVINNITIDANATGNFSLLIDHPTTGQPGALH